MKMLRRNVLLDMGELVGRYKTVLVELPDTSKAINIMGNIVSVAKGCRQFGEKDIGKKVIMKIFHDGDSRFSPEMSEQLGLKKHWHVIAHEEKLQCYIEGK